jgi:hypothetical protein
MMGPHHREDTEDPLYHLGRQLARVLGTNLATMFTES